MVVLGWRAAAEFTKTLKLVDVKEPVDIRGVDSEPVNIWGPMNSKPFVGLLVPGQGGAKQTLNIPEKAVLKNRMFAGEITTEEPFRK